MSTEFTIKVILQSKCEALFEGIDYISKYNQRSENGINLTINTQFPPTVTITPPTPDDPIKSIEYSIFTDIKNYHTQIIPDTGRSYADRQSMSMFFKFMESSSINNVRMPIHIFTGQDHYMSLAFGVIGENYESDFFSVEPEVRRALIVYMRRLSFTIKRGTDLYPIPDSIAQKNPDGSISEKIFYCTNQTRAKQPWLLTLREFAEYQKQTYQLKDFTTPASMLPLWCSWTDWFSDDVTDKVILDNAREGVKLGIKNYIIDDGWFGPGLDNDVDVEIDMGDWEPDRIKIKDMAKLVRELKGLGAVPMIWCAPHAVAPAAKCFKQRQAYLIMDDKENLLMTHNGFHCLCFMSPEAREIMADICASFIERWDFDGAKYDLFNCVANLKCANPNHHHDVSSMIEGLDKTLALIDQKTRQLKPDYIVELKQNYGTPFLARYGTMMRAGDTPYNPEGNFARTIYNQAYTPYSINDYQTITNEETPETTACIVIKMITAGIPSYSIDLFRLNQANKTVIANYNNWYIDNIELFHNYRVPLDADNNIFKIAQSEHDYLFLVNTGGIVDVNKSTTILNGTFEKSLFIKLPDNKIAVIKIFDCEGTLITELQLESNAWLDVVPGSKIELNLSHCNASI